jgi:CheY-like chemotaxis protein
MMGGEITVTSEYEKGSVFAVILPLKRGSAAELSPEEVTVIPFVAPKAKVLLADDIEINLEIASFMLNTFEIKPDTAKNGIESLEKAKNKDYDLILMDHMMPEMDGVEAAIKIREWEKSQRMKNSGSPKDVPIVALTANAVSGAREMFLSNGFNDLLSKPMDPKALAEALLRWLPEELIKK